MPIYEYVCEKCAERFEEYLSTSDKPVPPCPKCGSDKRGAQALPINTEWLPAMLPGTASVAGTDPAD